MSEKPIIFSGAMVKAILEGRKTMTRRIIKPAGDVVKLGDVMVSWPGDAVVRQGVRFRRFPYAVGDVLWVRESFIPDAPVDDVAWDKSRMSGVEWNGCGRPLDAIPSEFRSPNHVIYRADPKWSDCQDWRWRPSIHMPRWASRISLGVIAVKVERLQDISEKDAKAEGAERPIMAHWCDRPFASTFRGIWQDIHGDGAWAENPWVVAVTFERISV